MERCLSGRRRKERSSQFAKRKVSYSLVCSFSHFVQALMGTLKHFRPSMVNSVSTYKFYLLSKYGEMSEWSKVHAWKACVVKATAGSNPVLSAN